jgi:hypothetical protein
MALHPLTGAIASRENVSPALMFDLARDILKIRVLSRTHEKGRPLPGGLWVRMRGPRFYQWR